jgi:hypothetical protein
MAGRSGTGERRKTTRPPTGWIAIAGEAPGSVDYRPDPDHPAHPFNDATRREPRIRQWLDEDSGVQRFIEEARPAYDAAFGDLRRRLAQGFCGPLTMAWLEQAGDNLLKVAYANLEAESQRLSPPDIDPWVTFYYLLGKLVPKDLSPRILSEIEPVSLFANAHGAIFMKFTGATAKERGQWDEVIRKAQQHFGHRTDTGGRPSSDRDPEPKSTATTAAKLHHWLGWTYVAIGEFFGWTGTRAAIEKRVGEAVAAGDRALKRDIDHDWKLNPPKRISDTLRDG